MKKKLNNFFRKRIIKNIIILISGTASAQLIALISSPIITRLYGPDASGVMGTFMAFVKMLIPIAALTYPIAIVLPKNNQNAKGLIKLSMIISTIVATIISLTLIVFYDEIISLFSLESVSNYLFLIPLVILFLSFLQVMDQWLIRTKQLCINAKVAFMQSIIINSSKIGIGVFYPVAAVLIVFSSIANGLRAILMLFLLKLNKKNIDATDLNELSERNLSLKELLIKYKDFPLYRAPEVLMNSVSQRIPVLMLSVYFGPASAGFYTLSNTVLQQPIRLIGDSVGNVFY